VAAKARDGEHLLGVVRMMGDTSLATVNRHYFNLEDEMLQEIVACWVVPEVDLFGSCRLPVAG
jgi:hypothetical protein